MVKLFVEPLQSIFACCDRLITASDVASASRFQNESRRTEHLAWRRIVRRELGCDVAIDYNSVGAPIVDRANTYISASHTTGAVAVAIADVPVGVDIESLHRGFERVASRYLSHEESQLSTDERWAAMVWSAKEAMYKLYGRKGVDLVADLSLTSYDASEGCAYGAMRGLRGAKVELSIYDEDMIVAVATYI
jgi:phosphopantetheinyl transferase